MLFGIKAMSGFRGASGATVVGPERLFRLASNAPDAARLRKLGSLALMGNLFPDFNPSRDECFDALTLALGAEEVRIYPDASLLIHCYEMNAVASDNLLTVFEGYADKVGVPTWAARETWEYADKRITKHPLKSLADRVRNELTRFRKEAGRYRGHPASARGKACSRQAEAYAASQEAGSTPAEAASDEHAGRADATHSGAGEAARGRDAEHGHRRGHGEDPRPRLSVP